MKIITVAGARPNFMKVKPVMDALEARGADVVLVHTGQHYDDAMNDVFFRDLGLRKPDRHLGSGPTPTPNRPPASWSPSNRSWTR